ncbi:hypothetical protein GCM10023212_38190 [Luteolibacter yonseiensis]
MLVTFVGWVGVTKFSDFLPPPPDEQTWMLVTVTLAMAFLVSLTAVFARAGKILLQKDQLVVSTPLGSASIPYSQIETIRRCRRSGRQQHLQIIFKSDEDRKILKIRPSQVSDFAAQLRRKCPHLSSSSDQTLIRQSGQEKLLHSL